MEAREDPEIDEIAGLVAIQIWRGSPIREIGARRGEIEFVRQAALVEVGIATVADAVRIPVDLYRIPVQHAVVEGIDDAVRVSVACGFA